MYRLFEILATHTRSVRNIERLRLSIVSMTKQIV